MENRKKKHMESVDHFSLYFVVHTNVITRVNSRPLLPRHDVVLLGEFGAIVLCNGLGLQPTCRFGTGFNGIYQLRDIRVATNIPDVKKFSVISFRFAWNNSGYIQTY